MSELNGKVVVVTGATSGIGQAAAEKLASMGARIVQVARNPVRGAAAIERLNKINPAVHHTVHYADLSSIAEMKRVGAEIGAGEPHIDVLINNAGAMFNSRQLTVDGLERTFAVNHVAYFVLTNCLLDSLIASAPSRVINTSSGAHVAADLDFEDLQSARAYKGNFAETLRYGGPGFKVYGRSKLCNILFTRELARRLAGAGVTVNCFHPGFVRTRFGDEAGGFLGVGIGFWKRFARPAEKGAETLIYLAASPDVVCSTGDYFHDLKPIQPSPAAMNNEAAQRLWAETEKLVGPACANSRLADGT